MEDNIVFHRIAENSNESLRDLDKSVTDFMRDEMKIPDGSHVCFHTVYLFLNFLILRNVLDSLVQEKELTSWKMSTEGARTTLTINWNDKENSHDTCSTTVNTSV